MRKRLQRVEGEGRNDRSQGRAFWVCTEDEWEETVGVKGLM